MSPHTNSEGQDGQMGHTVASNQPTTMHHCSNQTRQQARTPPPPLLMHTDILTEHTVQTSSQALQGRR